MKDRQFLKLIDKVKDEEIPVLRGKHGITQSVNAFNLVVGDVILIETGSRIPADCLLISGNDVTVDERYYHPSKHSIIKNKNVCTEDNHGDTVDPFLYTQSLVTRGSGKALVCAVGDHSRRGTDKAQGIEDNADQTPLQEKLDNVGTQLSKYAILAAGAIFVAGVGNMLFSIVFLSHY